MTPGQLRHASAELDLVRRRRELFFWTIRMIIALIVLLAMTVAYVGSLIDGAFIDAAHLAIGAGITSASAAGGQILGLRRRFDRLGPPA